LHIEAKGITKRRANMVMIGRVMLAMRHLVLVALLGMKGTVIGLCGQGAGPVLHGFDDGGDCQRQDNDQAGAKRPDSCPSC
jgi:hypothetical protein